MYKTFSIDNMETYFKHYIPCNEHRRQPITNFCTERICLKFMCPQCVQAHSKSHANHPIQSIKTCLKKTSSKIQETIAELQQETNQNAFLKYKTPEEYENQLIRELDEVRKSLISQINSYFKDKEVEVKKQTSKSHETRKKLYSLQEEMNKAISELKQLNNNLFVNSQTVTAIKKANKIDYPTLVTHFRKHIKEVKNDLDLNVKVEMNNLKRDQFRKALNNLVGIRNKNERQTFVKEKASPGSRLINKKRQQNFRLITEEQAYNDRAQFVTNPPPLSADRFMSQAAFKISYPNYFQTQAFLHFFQASKSNLYFLKIKDIKENAPIKWTVIPLQVGFPIPSFHRTVATEDGNIYIVGGTFPNMEKSNHIYQYQPLHKTLKKVGELTIPRSSHSMVCLQKVIYIVGGMIENELIPKKCQVFDSRTNKTKLISSCKYQTINSTLCSLGKDNLIKLGGVDSEGKNSDYIEVYNIAADFWGQIDPTIESIKGQFGLLSSSGWAPLNENQIFIFGGYNEEAENENSKTTFVLEYNSSEKQFYIKHVNVKNLPMAQGFWNPQGIVHNGLIYALQNVDGQDLNDCLEDQRNILIFNGKYWSSCLCSQ